MHPTARLLGALVGATLLTACGDDATAPATPTTAAASAEDRALEASPGGVAVKQHADAQILRATGDITGGVQQYRALLGGANNLGQAGEKADGRREVNWDGVPAAVTNTNTFPANFFAGRGLITNPIGAGTGLRVSDNGFTDVNASYAGAFPAFSPAKTFAAVGTTEMEVRFVVAGSTTPARVTGFGTVFSGVDRSRSATLEFYDASGKRLETVAAPRGSDAAGLSFAGAVFPAPVVAYVRISTGDAALGADAADTSIGKTDLAVLDDFVYGEPHAP